MKKLVILIVSVMIANTINAQSEDIAFAYLDNDSFTESTVNNRQFTIDKSAYNYASAKGTNASSVIKHMENIIANYDLTTNRAFDTSNRANYKVVFKQKNSKAIVNYNTDGEIISSIERYKNVKIPIKIAVLISLNNNGFYLKKTTVYKRYKRNTGFVTNYKVIISNGQETKTLKIFE